MHIRPLGVHAKAGGTPDIGLHGLMHAAPAERHLHPAVFVSLLIQQVVMMQTAC